jgi:hypothetical protein
MPPPYENRKDILDVQEVLTEITQLIHWYAVKDPSGTPSDVRVSDSLFILRKLRENTTIDLNSYSFLFNAIIGYASDLSGSSFGDNDFVPAKWILQQITDAVVGLFDDRGNYDASSNQFPSTGGSGTAGAILKGDIWTISVAGTLGGTSVIAGDTVRALSDTPGQTASNWAINASSASLFPSITDDGTDVDVDANMSVTGQAHSGNHVQTFAASTTFDADNGTNQYMLVSGDCTINISNLNVGVMTIKLKNSGSGHTITIGSSFGDPMDDIGTLKTADGDTNTIMVIRGADDTYEYTINGRTV